MPASDRWEYKTILQPSIDEWLLGEQSLMMNAAMGKDHHKIIEKHCAYLNTMLSTLGKEGWELVAMWQSQPTKFFAFSANWLTFKRRVG